jgi:predicted dehydrogenase
MGHYNVLLNTKRLICITILKIFEELVYMSYKVGVVGGGRGLGPASMFNLMPDCKVVAACDPDKEAQERCAESFPEVKVFGEYEAMLDYGLDIVVVGTPMPLHAEQTTAALNAGCHVLQEVTLSNTIEGCRQILEAVKANPKQKFMLGENCCYWAHILTMKSMWEQGIFGKFVYGEAEYVHNIRDRFRNADGSPTWRVARPAITYCTHSLGPLFKITGERCVSISSMQTAGNMEPELNVTDFAVAIMHTSGGGVIKYLRGQALVREPAFHYYSLYGTKGCVETTRPPVEPLATNAFMECIPNTANMVKIPVGNDAPGLPAEATKGGHGTAEYLMVSDFMDCIRNDKPSPIDIYAALDMTLPGLCAYESSVKGGQPIVVPDFRSM